MINVIFSPTENDVLFFARHFMISNIVLNPDYHVHVVENDSFRTDFLSSVFGKKISLTDFFPSIKDQEYLCINFCYENCISFSGQSKVFNFFSINNDSLVPCEWSRGLYECIFKRSTEKDLVQIFCDSFVSVFNYSPLKNSWHSLNRPSILRKSNISQNGIAVRNDEVRMIIKSSFFSEDSRLWHIPIKKDLSKRFFEINACENIVTDDSFYAMACLVLGKRAIVLKDSFTYCINDPSIEYIGV
jgi:hypothetical protein